MLRTSRMMYQVPMSSQERGSGRRHCCVIFQASTRISVGGGGIHVQVRVRVVGRKDAVRNRLHPFCRYNWQWIQGIVSINCQWYRQSDTHSGHRLR
jgi:hypothetical protein